MAGARAVQIGTAIATRGLAVFEEVTEEIAEFMEERGVKSLASIVGAAHG
jgi:dihydroorotate dehydrogenase (NAD+) catalytic subunit